MRVLHGEAHEHFGRLTDEWIQIYNAGHAAKDKAEKLRLYARMKEINLEQQEMLDKAKKENKDSNTNL